MAGEGRYRRWVPKDGDGQGREMEEVEEKCEMQLEEGKGNRLHSGEGQGRAMKKVKEVCWMQAEEDKENNLQSVERPERKMMEMKGKKVYG